MTLRRTMAYQIAAMIAGLLVIAATSFWGLNALHQDFGSALRGYQELRRLYEVGSHVATAKALLSTPRPDTSRALLELENARTAFQSFLADPGRVASVADVEQAITQSLGEAIQQIGAAAELESVDTSAQSLTAPLNPVLSNIANLASRVRATIETSQTAANARRRTTILIVAVVSTAVILGAIVTGIVQYRSVMRPLQRLGDGVRKIAAGHFQQRMEVRGFAEFAALAASFNQMADELDTLYRELEQKVAQKSKELVRSERLASVGYLAAGVAHEINNPLGIMTGYAEMSLKKLAAGSGETAVAEATNALRIICEEAFRCKQIIEKLLSLAASSEDRLVISLADIARGVVEMVAGLPAYRDRRLTLSVDPAADVRVLGSEAEMKQVILNLALNALEAVEPASGQVTIALQRAEGMARLSVRDNGRGMSAAVLDRVFEPFFSARRDGEKRGTGLGLSITHAIIEQHGGSIRAHSDGVGKGSELIVELPAVMA
ncbi:MAG TPA: HAMP domain-containing sensor histidine kinase [Tepidisphaeraceae bacterium]|jgi:signal transduction histidine kinase